MWHLKSIFSRRNRALRYKVLFVNGAYITILIISVIGTVVDYLIGSFIDIPIDVSFFLLAAFAWRYSLINSDIELSAQMLFWIAAAMEFVYLYVHQVDFTLMFAVLIPIIVFIALPMHKIVINLTIFYLLLIGVMAYYYFSQPQNQFLHNPSYMLAYSLMHLFMIFYGFFYYLAIDESIRRLQKSDSQKAMLLHEVHHRVKNNLNLISSMLGLQRKKVHSDEAKEVIDKNQRRIESIALLHEILYTSDDLNRVDARKYLGGLIENIIAGSTEEGSVSVSTDIDENLMPLDQMLQIGILLNEMITNSIKHTSFDIDGCHIEVSFKKESGLYKLRYCDGAEQVDRLRLEQGYGYSLILLAVKQLKAEMKISVDDGLCYDIIFPELEV